MNRFKKTVILILTTAMLCVFLSSAAYGAGKVSAAIESTWKDAAAQIKDITNKVIFPAVDLVLAILFFVKLATSYFEYKKHGQFEFTGPAILFFGLIFSLTAPLYIWQILNL